MSIAKHVDIVTVIAAAAPFAAVAGTFTTLYTFAGKADGSGPYGPIVYPHGSLFGTTANGNGNVFRFDLSRNRLTIVHALSEALAQRYGSRERVKTALPQN